MFISMWHICTWLEYIYVCMCVCNDSIILLSWAMEKKTAHAEQTGAMHCVCGSVALGAINTDPAWRCWPGGGGVTAIGVFLHCTGV